MRSSVLLVGVAACYRPSPPAGGPCGPGDTCPAGLVCQLGACLPPGSAGDAPMPDAPIDMPPIDACVTFATQLDTCTLAGEPAPLDVTADATYDTGTHELVINGVTSTPPHVVVEGLAGPIDVLVVSTFSLAAGGSLRVTGPDPFGIVATDSISILGALDASNGGAGARSRTACATAAGINAGNDPTGAPGPGGGAFRGDGGDGAPGDSNNGQTPGSAGGEAVALPPGPLGGCPGGAGGIGDPGTAGTPGAGGGAVYLTSAGAITIAASGRVVAGGQGGGRGLTVDGSGGGGGSGGMIVIEGSTVSVEGVLAANGGGGGGGADDTASGGNGQNAQPSAVAATGGTAGGSAGGTGGAGGAGATLAGADAPGMPAGAGGGGGGGVGFIAIKAASSSLPGTISPGPSAWP